MRKTARLQHALFRLFIPTALVLSCLVGAAPAEDEFEDQGDDDWSTTTNVYQFGTEQFHDLDSADDEDWIKVELDEGEVYLFELYNAPEVNLELELYADAQDGGTTYLGRARAQSYMDNGVRNRIAYRAHRTATCFVRVYRSGSAADSYYFRTRLGSASGPLTNGGGETGGLLVAAQPVRLADGAIRGEFASPPNVRAGYRIDLAAGQRLVATAKLTGTASSPDLSLAYPSGYEIARKSMWRSGAAYEATIDFTAPFAGGYLLSLVSSQATASYEISFAGSAVAPTGRLAGQVQVDQGSAAGVRVRTARSGHEAFTDGEGRFALDLPAGTYDLIAEHSSIGATGFRGATVRSGETTEVTIAAEAVPDDDSESYEGANVVAPSDFPLQRAIDYPGDVDWYRFAAEGGKRYVVDLLRPTGSDVKLDYYYFTGALYREADLENGEPTPLGQVSEGYVGRRASVRLNDPGWIYVKLASGYGSPKVGLYELRVREEGAADPIDDDVFLAATPVETDGTLVPGVIATDGDEHYYSFDADQGERYDIAILRSAGVDASFEVVWVAPASTSEVLELDNPTGGEGLVHRQATFVPTPPGKQRYYVKVSPSDYACCPSVGTYELRIFGPGTDQTPPPRVTDLRAKSAAKEVIGAARADAGGGYVVLEWTAPQGAREYDVRYRTSTLSEEYWYDHAVMVRAPAPRPGGTAEQLLVSGLEPGTRYYFGVRSMDERLNVAEISNVVTAVASETAPITAVPAMTPLLAAWLTGWAIGLAARRCRRKAAGRVLVCYLAVLSLALPSAIAAVEEEEDRNAEERAALSHATELVDTGRFDEAMPILRDLINVSSLYSADRAILGTKARLEAVRAHLGKGELTEAHSAADGILTRHWPGGEGLWASTAREMFGARIASEPVEESDDFLVFRAKVYYWSARLLDEANQGGVRLPRQPSARGAPGGAARQEVLRRSPCHFREGAAAIGCMVEQAVSDTGRVAGRMPAGCRNGASESRCAIYHDALAYRAALAAIAPLLSNTHGGAAPPPELVAARTALTAPTRHQRLRFAEAAYYGALQARDGAAVKEVCALPDARDAGLCTGAMAARLKSEAAAAANATAQPPRKPLMALPAPFQLELDRLLEDTATCSWTAEQAGASRLLRLGPDAYVSIAPDGEIDSVRIPVAIGQELANARTGGQVSFGHEAPFFIWFAANAASADSADDKARALCALNRAARDGNLPLLRHLISRYFDSASQRH